MNDPYKVLNVPSTATDDEVKHAYRELARKYHPDNYHDNPLADLAQEKMKEINEAYEMIQKQRKASSSYDSAQSYGGYQSRYGTSSSDPAMQQVRMAINRGDISTAERLLGAISTHSAEWNFLMGVVASRRGWMDEAKQYLQTAVQMDPGNSEYRNALNALGSTAYRPAGFDVFSTGGGNMCMPLCAASLCANMCGFRICCI